MKMIEFLKSIEQSRAYSIYSSIVDNPAKKGRITLAKMAKAICEEYKKPKNIISMCTTRELKVLQKVVNTDSKTLAEDGKYWSAHEWEITTLMFKAIFGLRKNVDGSPDCGIFDEIKESVIKALDIVDWQQKAFVDKIDEFFVGYYKVFGEDSAEDVIKMASEYFDCSFLKIYELFMDNKLMNYYVSGDIDYSLIKKNRAFRMYYIDYYDYIDRLKEVRKQRNITERAPIDLTYLKNIFYDEFNMDNTNIANYFKLYGKTPAEKIMMKMALSIAALLNMDHQQMKELYSSYFPSHDVENGKIFAAFEKAVDELPSAALNGFSARQIRQMKQKQKISKIKKNKTNLIQKNARISNKDVELFQKVYYGLLEFTKNKYKFTINWNRNMKDDNLLESEAFKKLLKKFWDNHLEIVTEFCTLNPYRYSKNEIKIAEDIKRAVYGEFVLAKYYDAYTAFVGDDVIYMVKGLADNIELIIDKEQLPILVTTAVIPFKNVLIFDGFLQQCLTESNLQEKVDKSLVELKKINKL